MSSSHDLMFKESWAIVLDWNATMNPRKSNCCCEWLMRNKPVYDPWLYALGNSTQVLHYRFWYTVLVILRPTLMWSEIRVLVQFLFTYYLFILQQTIFQFNSRRIISSRWQTKALYVSWVNFLKTTGEGFLCSFCNIVAFWRCWITFNLLHKSCKW